jgi:hypothetical protein
MNLPTVLAVAALAASLLLVFQVRRRLFPAIAAAASGFETLLALHVVHVSLRGVSLQLVLGAALAIAGAIIWARTGGKTHTTCATIVTMVGAIQLLAALF